MYKTREDVLDKIDDAYNKYKNNYIELAEKCLEDESLKVEKKAKIKTIALYYNRYRDGGVERVLSLIIPLYLEMDYKVVLITEEEPTEDDYELPQQVVRYCISNAQSIANGNLPYRVRANQILNILEKENVDLLSHHAVWSPLLFWDLLTIKLSNVYCILTKHDLFTREMMQFENNTENYVTLFKLFNKVVVLSRVEKTYWNLYGVDTEYIYNPVNDELSADVVQEHNDIIWVGRFEMKQKRYLDVVPIMKEVIKQYPHIRLVMYGKGCSIDRKILEEHIKENNLTENIILAGYNVDVREIYKNARIHLVTSTFEAFPMVIYESRLCGLPLVIYDMPYLELLRDKSGYVSVEYGDYKAAADAVVSILDDRKLEEKMSIDAMESVREYSAYDLKKRWMKLFDELSMDDDLYLINEQNVEMKIILQTINKHFNIAAKKNQIIQEMLYEQSINKIVKYVKEQKKGIVVYPYGHMAKKIIKSLDELGIKVEYAVDNGEVECSLRVLKVDELQYEDSDEYLYIITNNNPVIYDEIRKNILKYVKEENIYDMYPEHTMQYLLENSLV